MHIYKSQMWYLHLSNRNCNTKDLKQQLEVQSLLFAHLEGKCGNNGNLPNTCTEGP